MAAANDQHKVNVTLNGKTVSVPNGIHDFKQLAAYLGVPSAVKLTVTDPTPRSATVFNPHMSVTIQGGEVITSA